MISNLKIEQVAYLEQAVEPLVEHCARFLRERQAGVQRLKLIGIMHRERLPTESAIGVGEHHQRSAAFIGCDDRAGSSRASI